MSPISKRDLSEIEICDHYITPAIEGAGWEKTQIRREYPLTKGRVFVRGQMTARGKHKQADYVLFYKPNFPLAVVEAKSNERSVGHGIQQAQGYADLLDVPFVFSSNGDRFLFRDNTGLGHAVEEEIALDRFPSPEELWQRWLKWKNLSDEEEKVVTQDYYLDGSGKSPRYYQLQAINKAVEAIARGQNRILLVMATGTGKTYTAFQIIWRLWKSRAKKRILFLADRNILVDQTKSNDFKPFSKVITKIEHRKIDTSFEVYLSLYQAVTGKEEEKNVYKEFSPEFFDLIVVDECHRGSAAEASAWREILEYFSDATQIGMTATPKETKDVSNIAYFGEPVYSYTLKQGIEDGFLAPYKVVRIDLDRDLEGWRPERGKTDKNGYEIEDRIYNQKDFDRNLVLEQRTKLVAAKVTEFLKNTSRHAKTIVFCEDIEHAERMTTELRNQNKAMHTRNNKYVMTIVGDNIEGKMELDNFTNPEEPYPVIAVTSRLMTTGVDSQTCKLIALDRRIGSMTEFKQIIGRGTRINEEHGKLFFTIMDFRKCTELFADEAFDGKPVQIYWPGEADTVVPPVDHDNDEEPVDEESLEDDFAVHQSEIEAELDAEVAEEAADDEVTSNRATDLEVEERERPRKYFVGDVSVSVIGVRVQFMDEHGKLVTESLKDYTRKAIRKKYRSLDSFLKTWSSAEKKAAIIKELREQGVILEALEDEVGKGFGPFDLVCHVAFDQPPLTRKERADNVKKRNYFTKYEEKARKVLDALLDKYANEGVIEIEENKILLVAPISDIGTPIELVQAFGGPDKYEEALRELEEQIYTA